MDSSNFDLLVKNTVVILLTIITAIHTFSKWMAILQYEINRDYIASNFCINKAKPSLCCKGKCFLQKKLASDEGPQQSAGKLVLQDAQPDLFLPKPLQVDFRLPILIVDRVFFYLNGKSQEFIPPYFQPPRYLYNI